MRAFIFKLTALFVLFLSFISCEKKVQMPSNKFVEVDSTSTNMIKLNQLLADVEQDEMKAYVKASKLDFKQSDLSYWYAITNEGSGDRIKNSDIVLIDYQVTTVKGDLCYSYTGDKAQKLVVGKSQRERGFNEALQLLKEGSQAVFVIPSNLCFGMMGDAKKVPPRTALVYKINNIKKK